MINCTASLNLGKAANKQKSILYYSLVHVPLFWESKEKSRMRNM